MKSIVTCAAIALLALARTAPASAGELLPYQAQGWRYLQVSPGDPLESGFMDPIFDDSGWALGQAAFGNSQSGCPLHATVQTTWGLNSALLLRHIFVADPATAVTIHFSIDNDATVWVNGQVVASVIHENCPGLDDWNFVLPPSLVNLGANVVAVRALDRGGESFFDLRVEGDMPVPVRTRSWGMVKARYR